jgi:PAT family beta-lactamase induction signal transducer AmpG
MPLLLYGFLLYQSIVSGLILPLLMSVLTLWMQEHGFDLASLGFSASIIFPYSIKFLWAPLLDRWRFPGLSALFGRRLAWAGFFFAMVTLALLGMASMASGEHPLMFVLMACVLAAMGASYDTVIDAYRIEVLPAEKQALGASISTIGYRVGMLISGAGALIIADQWNWTIAYVAMAIFPALGVGLTAILAPIRRRWELQDPLSASAADKPLLPEPRTVKAWLEQWLIRPFIELWNIERMTVVLLFVLMFKWADSLVGTMTYPYYISLGFSKTELAFAVKTYGLIPTLVGSVFGAWLSLRMDFRRFIMLALVSQAWSNLGFVWLGEQGHHVVSLVAQVAIENFCSAFGNVAFIALLANQCRHPAYTATHYALLSSIPQWGRMLMGSWSGVFVEQWGWSLFFVVTCFFSLPCLGLLWCYPGLFTLGRASDQKT